MEFFSPIEKDMVSRTEQDEDQERIAQHARANSGSAGQVFAVWNPEERAKIAGGGIQPRVLVVAASDLACRLVHDAAGLTLKPLGSLMVAGVSARGNAVEPCVNDSSGFVYEVVGGDVVIAAAQYDVPAAAAREWANALLTAVAPTERVVIVGAVDEHDVNYGADGRRGCYVMDTAAMRRSAESTTSDMDVDTSVAPPLPPGALIAGISAGVLSRCELTVGLYKLNAVDP